MALLTWLLCQRPPEGGEVLPPAPRYRTIVVTAIVTVTVAIVTANRHRHRHGHRPHHRMRSSARRSLLWPKLRPGPGLGPAWAWLGSGLAWAPGHRPSKVAGSTHRFYLAGVALQPVGVCGEQVLRGKNRGLRPTQHHYEHCQALPGHRWKLRAPLQVVGESGSGGGMSIGTSSITAITQAIS
jgi:hypothetical protein